MSWLIVFASCLFPPVLLVLMLLAKMPPFQGQDKQSSIRMKDRAIAS
jgi:hypothetical protein